MVGLGHDAHKVIRKEPFEGRPTFRFGMSGDGKKLYIYGAGSTLEVFDAETLKSRKLLYLNKDTTTNLITLASQIAWNPPALPPC